MKKWMYILKWMLWVAIAALCVSLFGGNLWAWLIGLWVGKSVLQIVFQMALGCLALLVGVACIIGLILLILSI